MLRFCPLTPTFKPVPINNIEFKKKTEFIVVLGAGHTKNLMVKSGQNMFSGHSIHILLPCMSRYKSCWHEIWQQIFLEAKPRLIKFLKVYNEAIQSRARQ